MKEKFNYILYHLDLASMFIGICGIIGVFIGEKMRAIPMCVYAALYLGARFTWVVMVRTLAKRKEKENGNF